MSVVFRARVVVGVAVVCKTAVTYVTSHDDTGEPYRKQVIRDCWETAAGTPLAFNPSEIYGDKDTDLRWYSSDSDVGGVLGCEVAQVNSHNMDPVDLLLEDTLPALTERATAQLAALGCTELPTLLLHMMCS